MAEPSAAEIEDRQLWDEKAPWWDRHIGVDGDRNRRLHVHPVLFRMLGEVDGRRVLDAGCGTGYLAFELARRGAHVTAVDYAAGMVSIARARFADSELGIDCREDTITRLDTVPDASLDLVVSNYVLQDAEDYQGALRAFRRVLVKGGRAVLVLGHPCFGTPLGIDRHPDGSVGYRWPFSYFAERRCEEAWRGTDRQTGERFDFPGVFTFYHRPLSAYWRAMQQAGFAILDFDEPVMRPPYPDGMTAEEVAQRRRCAYSVAFALQAV
jgi:SAM-dependent methyltransferase